MRVLVIDDDQFILDLVGLMLRDRHETIMACSAEDGLKIILENNPDLILLDWMMPGMDGLSLLKLLKGNEKLNKVPVIFLSGKDENSAIMEAKALGASDYIVKPFTRNYLLDRISKFQHA